MRRVVVTGVGLVTPLATGTEESWAGLIEGRSGVGPIEGYESSSFRTRLGAEADDFRPEEFITNRRTLRNTTRNDQLAIAGATLAARDSGLDFAEQDSERLALFVGSNKEISNPMTLLDGTLIARQEDGTADIRLLGAGASSAFPPLYFVEGLQAASLFYISQAFTMKGANTYFAGTGESGAVAIGRGYRAVRRGEADVALAGGFDDAISWWNMTKFEPLGILTDENELGERAVRPFDRDRNGTVLGEGSAFLVLETYEAATARGARIYAEVTGLGSGYDAYKLLEPEPEGRGLQRAIEAALREAGSGPDEVDYVVADGSGTRKGDASEARALQAVFGTRNGTVASGVKAATGHLMGGAGALNAAVAALALCHGIVPPTLNLENLDPNCAFNWVAGEARDARPQQAIALARGLEGQNVALAMRAVQ
jgi:3-oxoacyl-[acyl-carrier-protein] synthase II